MSRIQEMADHFKQNYQGVVGFNRAMIMAKEQIETELTEFLGCEPEQVTLEPAPDDDLEERSLNPKMKLMHLIITFDYLRSHPSGQPPEAQEYKIPILFQGGKRNPGKHIIFNEQSFSFDEIGDLINKIWNFIMEDERVYEMP